MLQWWNLSKRPYMADVRDLNDSIVLTVVQQSGEMIWLSRDSISHEQEWIRMHHIVQPRLWEKYSDPKDTSDSRYPSCPKREDTRRALQRTNK